MCQPEQRHVKINPSIPRFADRSVNHHGQSVQLALIIRQDSADLTRLTPGGRPSGYR
jgi:hypothetical protein